MKVALRSSSGESQPIPPSLLSFYFRDMSQVAPFTPSQEQETAHRLIAKEREAWQILLDMAAHSVPLQQSFQRNRWIGPKDLFPLSARRVQALARVLRQKDIDRLLIAAALATVSVAALSAPARALWK